MKTLVAKEIRLLLPAYGAALLLAVLPVWLTPRTAQNNAEFFALFPFWLGVTLLALSAFGREFGLHTFSLLLAQPVYRRRIWWTKVAVLAGALATLLVVLGFSCIACVYFVHPPLVWPKVLALAGVGVVVAFAGGLWTTLLLRQVSAAFWFTILIPWFVVLGVWLQQGNDWLVYTALGLYSVAGFWGAWWLFRRAQDAAWTGGVISLPTWTRSTGVSSRVRRPIVALCWKELKMHQVWLVGMACLFLAHLGVVALRNANLQDYGGASRIFFLEVVAGIWLVVPLLASSLSIADERKLGTWQNHLCLPVSSRIQFLIKLLFVLLFPGLLSTVLCCTAESFSNATTSRPDFGDILPIFLGLSLIGFYASSIARNTMQALAAAVGMALAALFFSLFLSHPWRAMGIRQQGYLMLAIGWLTLTVTLLGLAYHNFRSVSEAGRLWGRNLLGICTAVVFIFTSTLLIYHRTWELLTPAEPPHGPARLPVAKTAPLVATGSAIAAVLPDGTLWMDHIAAEPGWTFSALNNLIFATSGKWMRLNGTPPLASSNWVQVSIMTPRETVAIQSNGSLWLLQKPHQTWFPAKDIPPVKESITPVRMGDSTNWQSVARETAWSVILLRRDGTLWRWGTNWFDSKQKWPGLRTFQPQPMGTDSDWASIHQSATGGTYLWKQDGQAWALYRQIHNNKPRSLRELAPDAVIVRFPALDNTPWRSMAAFMAHDVGVRHDGTLWAWRRFPRDNEDNLGSFQSTLRQLGRETNWVAVADGYDKFATLKADGSLWIWNNNYLPLDVRQGPPMRLGTHNDWVTIGSSWGIVALAADGSLWRWGSNEGPYLFGLPMMAPSRKPIQIQNYADAGK